MPIYLKVGLFAAKPPDDGAIFVRYLVYCISPSAREQIVAVGKFLYAIAVAFRC